MKLTMKSKRKLYHLKTVAIIFATAFLVDPGHAAEHVIEIQSFKYVPERVEALPGDIIIWINRDIVPHTATAADSSWDTGEMAAGERKRVVLPIEFTRDYHCVYHPSMRGSL